MWKFQLIKSFCSDYASPLHGCRSTLKSASDFSKQPHVSLETPLPSTHHDTNSPLSFSPTAWLTTTFQKKVFPVSNLQRRQLCGGRLDVELDELYRDEACHCFTPVINSHTGAERRKQLFICKLRRNLIQYVNKVWKPLPRSSLTHTHTHLLICVLKLCWSFD